MICGKRETNRHVTLFWINPVEIFSRLTINKNHQFVTISKTFYIETILTYCMLVEFSIGCLTRQNRARNVPMVDLLAQHVIFILHGDHYAFRLGEEMPPLLSTTRAEALWIIVNFLELALALIFVPSRVRRSK